jgi:hypothetical protein
MTDTMDFGHWEVVMPDNPRGAPVPHYRGLVCLIATDPYIAVVASDGHAVTRHDWPRNARLIAAAPEMLAALQAARPYLISNVAPLEVYQQVVNAIDKAQGRAET